MSFSKILLNSLSLFLIQACKDSPSSASGKKPSPDTQSTQAIYSEVESKFSSPTTAKTTGFSLASLEEKLAKMHPDNLAFFKDQIREFLMAHPEQAGAILAHYSELLFKHSPAEAITFAMAHSDYLPPGDGDRISAQLIKTWHHQDPSALETHFHTLAKHKGGTEQECHKALQLLMKPGDGPFDSSTWLAWLNTLSKGREQKGELQGEVLNTMLSLIDPTDPVQLSPLTSAYYQHLNDIGTQKHLPNFADIIAKHRPEESQRLLADMPGGLYRDEVLERTIAELGRSHPEIGAEWLSSPDILENIFRPEFEDEKERAQEEGIAPHLVEEAEKAFEEHVNQVFDRTLETYIFSILHKHPEDAMKNVDSLINAEHRENLRKRVQAIIERL